MVGSQDCLHVCVVMYGIIPLFVVAVDYKFGPYRPHTHTQTLITIFRSPYTGVQWRNQDFVSGVAVSVYGRTFRISRHCHCTESLAYDSSIMTSHSRTKVMRRTANFNLIITGTL